MSVLSLAAAVLFRSWRCHCSRGLSSPLLLRSYLRLSISVLFTAVAGPCYSSPTLDGFGRFIANALLNVATPMPRYTSPFHCWTPPITSMPLRFATNRYHANAYRFSSDQCHFFLDRLSSTRFNSLPLHYVSAPSLCLAALIVALPLHHYAARYRSVSLLCLRCSRQRRSIPSHRRRDRTMPMLLRHHRELQRWVPEVQPQRFQPQESDTRMYLSRNCATDQTHDLHHRPTIPR